MKIYSKHCIPENIMISKSTTQVKRKKQQQKRENEKCCCVFVFHVSE